MKFIFFILAFVCGRIYLFADTYTGAKTLHGLGLHILLFSVLCYMVWVIPYKQLERKLFWLGFTIYEFTGMLTYAIVQFKVLHNYSQEFLIYSWGTINKSGAGKLSLGFKELQDFAIPIFIFVICYILYHKLKRLDHKLSDKINNDNVFILFQYPKNIIGLVLSIFWKYPVSTVSLYIDGYKYGFVRDTKKFQKVEFDNKKIKHYFVKDTGIHKSQILHKVTKMIGTRWSLKTNCLNFYKSLLGAI